MGGRVLLFIHMLGTWNDSSSPVFMVKGEGSKFGAQMKLCWGVGGGGSKRFNLFEAKVD